MKINKELIKELKNIFKYSEAHLEERVYDGKNAYELNLDKKGDTLTLTLKLSENPNKKKIEELIKGTEDDIWATTMEDFQKLTGVSVNDMNKLYEKGEYDKVLNLLDPVIKASAIKQANEYVKEINRLTNKYGLNDLMLF